MFISPAQGFSKGLFSKVKALQKKTLRQTIKRKHNILKCVFLMQTPDCDSTVSFIYCGRILESSVWTVCRIGAPTHFWSFPFPIQAFQNLFHKTQDAKARKPLRIIWSGLFSTDEETKVQRKGEICPKLHRKPPRISFSCSDQRPVFPQYIFAFFKKYVFLLSSKNSRSYINYLQEEYNYKIISYLQPKY